MIKYKIIVILSFLFFYLGVSQEQESKTVHNDIFKSVEQGMKNSNVSLFSEFFGKQVYLNLRDSESGVFSANQAFYILQNYLSNRKIVSFQLTTFGYADKIPFAVGNFVFKFKSSHIFTNVYISLAFIDEQWVIDKINFY